AIPTAPTTPAPNGSIFQATQPVYFGYQPLFEDRRPRNIGDTLTITLQENVSASKNSSANASRNGKAGFLASITPRFLEGLL
ncbi:flagellar basal body L-ring protein FlgH, partial [Escherichia coli]